MLAQKALIVPAEQTWRGIDQSNIEHTGDLVAQQKSCQPVPRILRVVLQKVFDHQPVFQRRRARTLPE